VGILISKVEKCPVCVKRLLQGRFIFRRVWMADALLSGLFRNRQGRSACAGMKWLDKVKPAA
jgi:hypothetical protein